MTFRAELLAGRRVVLAPEGRAPHGPMLEALGAWTCALGGEALLDDDDRAAAWVRDRAPLQALVYDARVPFGGGDEEGLRTALELAWRSARAAATGAMIDAGRPAKLVFIAPPPDAGPLASAARAALQNLARTLSVEWARFELTAVSIAPGATTGADELAELIAFLVSDGGGYISGCELELGAVEPLIRGS